LSIFLPTKSGIRLMFVPLSPLCLGGFLIPHDLICCIDEKEGVTDEVMIVNCMQVL